MEDKKNPPTGVERFDCFQKEEPKDGGTEPRTAPLQGADPLQTGARSAPMWKPGDDLPKDIIFDFEQHFELPKFMFSYKGVGLCPTGDIQAIKGLEGNGKSFLACIMMATALGADMGDFTCNLKGGTVLLVDTEQHPRSIALTKDRICRMCGVDPYKDNVRFHILTLIDVDDPALCLAYTLDAIKRWNPRMVVLDGIADLAMDINDRKECTKLVRQFHSLAKSRECMILNIIHTNYGNDKAQGNLGTIMRHKVSDEIQCSKKKEGGRIFFEVSQTKARNKDIEMFEFEVHDDTYRIGIPVITSPEDWDVDTPKHRKACSDMLQGILNGTAMSKTKLRDEIHVKHFAGNDKSRAEGWVNRAMRWGIIKENRNHQWEFVGQTETDDPLGEPQQTDIPF